MRCRGALVVVDGEIVDAEPAVERAASLWGIDPVGMPAGGQFGAEFAGSLGSVSQGGQRMRFFSKQFQPDGRSRHLAAHPPDRADQLGHGVLGGHCVLKHRGIQGPTRLSG